MRRPSPAALLTALVAAAAAGTSALAGCTRCAPRPSGSPAARFVPAEALAALVVPRLGEAARQAAALHGALVERPGTGDLGRLRTALGAQLGVDLFDPASLAGAGLDPERSLAVALLTAAAGSTEPQPLLVLPSGDDAKLRGLIDRLARDRLGAGDPQRDGPFEVWRRAPGEPPALSLAFTSGVALLAPGAGGPEALRGALRLEASGSLEQGAAWRQALAALGEAPALLGWLPPGSPALRPLLGLPALQAPGGLVAGLSASARGARLVAAALLLGEEARLRPLAGTGPGRGGALAVSPVSAVAARLSADPKAALALLGDRFPPPLLPLRPVVEALAAPVDAGLTLAPEASLARALAGREDDPLRLLRVELAAPLQAGGRAEAALAALAGPSAVQGRDGTWRARLDGGAELTWAVRGQALHLTAGPAGLPPLPAEAAAFAAPTAASTGALAGGLGGAVVHLDNLGRAVRALPPSAYGTGPDAVVTRSLAQKLAALPGRGAAASLRADLPGGALRLALELELGEPPEPRP